MEIVEDITTWTQDQLQSYLDKYNIPYHCDEESSLVQTVKSYRDAVAENAAMFGEKVDAITSGLKNKLEMQKDLSKSNMDALLSEIQHSLRQLELQGELSRDRVSQALDRLRKRAIKQKIVTEAQWRDIYNDVLSPFESQTWYQRVIHRYPTNAGASTSLNRWLQHVASRLLRAKDLTEDQVGSVIDQLRASLGSTRDLSQLGDKHWWHKFQRDLRKQNKLTQEQVQKVTDDLRHDVNAYKIFATDYLGRGYDQAQQWTEDWSRRILDSGYKTIDWIYDWMGELDARLRTIWPPVRQLWRRVRREEKQHPVSAYETLRSAASSVSADWQASAKSAAASVTDAAAASASSIRAQVTDAANACRDSFTHFWRDQEREAYRRLGYTEAQLDWIQKYLSKVFTDQKSFAKANVDQALQNIRHYLQDAQVQSQAQVQHQIDQLRLQIEEWKTKQLREAK